MEQGIDLIKDLVTDTLEFVKEYKNAKEDGHISKFEWARMGDDMWRVGKDLMQVKEIIAQAKDTDSEERKELLDHIVAQGVLGNDAEVILVNTFEYIEGQILLWENNIVPIINVFKK